MFSCFLCQEKCKAMVEIFRTRAAKLQFSEPKVSDKIQLYLKFVYI